MVEWTEQSFWRVAGAVAAVVLEEVVAELGIPVVLRAVVAELGILVVSGASPAATETYDSVVGRICHG